MNRSNEQEQGFTLVELLVVVLILGVVGGVVVASVARSLQITVETTERTTALTDIERGLERVTRQIRVADPLLIDPDGVCDALTAEVCEETVLQRRLDAQSYAGGQLILNSYFLVDTADGTQLQQDVTITDIDTGIVTTNASGQFIADIANIDTGTPLFRFLAPDSVTGELEELDCTGLSVDDCRSTYATASVVEMTLSKVLRDATPLTASTAVNIRNTRYDP